MLDEYIAMIEELEADIKVKEIEVEQARIRADSNRQELEYIRDLINEADPEFDASQALIRDLKIAFKENEIRTKELKDELIELIDRYKKIKDAVEDVRKTMLEE